MKGHNPSASLLQIYDTVKQKPFEFMHSRSFVNLNVATGWVVSSGGKFPYENKIKLPVEEGDFPITLEYQPQATIQPNADETCAPSNFPYIETTGINEVTLYSWVIPNTTNMIPIVVNLTQNGSPFGSTNASSTRSTIETTSIQLSQNYFLIETENKYTVKDEVISFTVKAYKGGTPKEIERPSEFPKHAVFNLDMSPITQASTTVANSIDNTFITVTVTIPKNTLIKDDNAVIYFPVQAGGVFYPRASVTTTSSREILDQIYSYNIISGDLSRSTEGYYYANGVAIEPEKGYVVTTTQTTLNGVVSPAVGEIIITDERDNIIARYSTSGSLMIPTDNLTVLDNYSSVKMKFVVGGIQETEKNVIITTDIQNTILQTSETFVVAGSTRYLRVNAFTLLEGDLIFPKNGTISFYYDSVGGEPVQVETNTSSSTLSLTRDDEFIPISEYKNIIVTFKDVSGVQLASKIVPIVGTADSDTEFFNLVVIPSVLTVETDKDFNIQNRDAANATLRVFRNGAEVTGDFTFAATVSTNENIDKFSYSVTGNTLQIDSFESLRSSINLMVTATHGSNSNIKVQGSLLVNRSVFGDGLDYYTHVKYSKSPDGVNMSNEIGPYMGIAISTNKDSAPTDPAEYKWVPYNGATIHIRYSDDGQNFTEEVVDVNGTPTTVYGEKPGRYMGILNTTESEYKDLNITDENKDELFLKFTWTSLQGPEGRPGEQGVSGGLRIVGPTNAKFSLIDGKFVSSTNMLTYFVESDLGGIFDLTWYVLQGAKWESLEDLALAAPDKIIIDEHKKRLQIYTDSDLIKTFNDLTIKATAHYTDLDKSISDIHNTFFLYSNSGDYYGELVVRETGEGTYSFAKDKYNNIISGTVSSNSPLILQLNIFKGTTKLTPYFISNPNNNASDIMGTYDIIEYNFISKKDVNGDPITDENGVIQGEFAINLNNEFTSTEVYIEKVNGRDEVFIKVLDLDADRGKININVLAEGLVKIPISFEWNSYIKSIDPVENRSIHIYSQYSSFVNNSLDSIQIQEFLKNPTKTVPKEGFVYPDAIKLQSEVINTDFDKWYYSYDGGLSQTPIIPSNNILEIQDLFHNRTARVIPNHHYLLVSNGKVTYSFGLNQTGSEEYIGTSDEGGRTFIYTPSGAEKITITSLNTNAVLLRLEYRSIIDPTKPIPEEEITVSQFILEKINAEFLRKPNYLYNYHSFDHEKSILDENGDTIELGKAVLEQLNKIYPYVLSRTEDDILINDTLEFRLTDNTDATLYLSSNEKNHFLTFPLETAYIKEYFPNFNSELTIIAKSFSNQSDSFILKREFNPYDSLEENQKFISKLTSADKLEYSDFDMLNRLLEQAEISEQALKDAVKKETISYRERDISTINLAKAMTDPSYSIPKEGIESIDGSNPYSFYSAALSDEDGYLISFRLSSSYSFEEEDTPQIRFSARQLTALSSLEYVASNLLSFEDSEKTYYYYIKNSVQQGDLIIEESDWRDEALLISQETNSESIPLFFDTRQPTSTGVGLYTFEFKTIGTSLDNVVKVSDFRVIELIPKVSVRTPSLWDSLLSRPDHTTAQDLLFDYFDTLSNNLTEARVVMNSLADKFVGATTVLVKEDFEDLPSPYNEDLLTKLTETFNAIWTSEQQARNRINELNSISLLKDNFEIRRTNKEFSMGYYDGNMFMSGLQITPLGTLLKDEKIQVVGSTSIGSLYGRKMVIGKTPNKADYDHDKIYAKTLSEGFIGIWNSSLNVWSSNLDKKGHTFYRYGFDENGEVSSLTGHMIMNGAEIAAYQYYTPVTSSITGETPYNGAIPYDITYKENTNNNYYSYPVFQISDEGKVLLKDLEVGLDSSQYREGTVDLFGQTKILPFYRETPLKYNLSAKSTKVPAIKGIVFIGSTIGGEE